MLIDIERNKQMEIMNEQFLIGGIALAGYCVPYLYACIFNRGSTFGVHILHAGAAGLISAGLLL